MSKSEYTKNENSIEILNVGLFGHIDHGKTTLLYRLSGKWTDTHSEELKRGITIKLGYANISIYKKENNYNTNGDGVKIREISFVDAPGHEMLMATMLSGSALIDVALLIIAVNEGIKAQTYEHLMALHSKKVKNLVVIQNKIDLVDEKRAKENYIEIKNFLKGKYDDAIIIPVSAQQGINIDYVLKILAEIEIPKRDMNKDPIFLVARSFDVNRPGSKPEDLNGSVLGGTLKCGKLKIGDDIEIKPGNVVKESNKFRYETIKTKIRKLFRGDKETSQIFAGGSIAIQTELDMALGKNDLLAGNVVSLVDKLPNLSEQIKIRFSLFPEIFIDGSSKKTDEIKVSEILMLSVNTSTTGGIVNFIEGDKFSLSLKKPVVVFKGDNVGIARNIKGHWRLIGYGDIC